VDLDGKKIAITGSTAVIGGERVTGTTKSGRARVVSIDDATVAVLRQHKADQAADQLRAGDSWRGIKDGHVFTTGWGEPIYPDTVTSLMTKLVRAHNGPDNGKRPRSRYHTHGCTTSDTFTPRRCRSRVFPFMSLLAAWCTPTPPSRFACTPT
jgi:integrase